MKLLPKWFFNGERTLPNEYEQNTVLEKTAMIQKAINEIVNEYNKFAEKVNTDFENYKNEIDVNMETYEMEINQQFQDFIDVIDLKIAGLENEIQNSINTYEARVENELTKVTNGIQEFYNEKEYLIVDFGNEMNAKYDALEQEVQNTTVTKVNEIIDGKITVGFPLDFTYNAETDELIKETTISDLNNPIAIKENPYGTFIRLKQNSTDENGNPVFNSEVLFLYEIEAKTYEHTDDAGITTTKYDWTYKYWNSNCSLTIAHSQGYEPTYSIEFTNANLTTIK